MLPVVRVERAAVIADSAAEAEATAEPVHGVLADDGAARLKDPSYHGRVKVRDKSLEGEGPEAHGHTCHRDMILVADGLASQESL